MYLSRDIPWQMYEKKYVLNCVKLLIKKSEINEEKSGKMLGENAL